MRHSHIVNHKEWALTIVNGVARSIRRGGRGRHKPKTPAALFAAEQQARRIGASETEIAMARDLTTLIRF
jgi:hypothetical protein